MRKVAWLAVLALIPSLALAATPKRGVFSGQTSQNKTIKFTVIRGGIHLREIEVGWESTCSPSGDMAGKYTFTGTYRIAHGKFKATADGQTISGEFRSRNKATGTFRFVTQSGSSFGHVTCDTGTVTWTATRG